MQKCIIRVHFDDKQKMEVPVISDEINKSDISSRKKLKNRLTTGVFALLIALIAVVSATYAWYIYNTSRHTTKVRMAAGAGVNLQISNSYSGTYGSAAVLDCTKTDIEESFSIFCWSCEIRGQCFGYRC